MNRNAILEKYNKNEEHILVSKVLDKIELRNRLNKIANTDFLDLYQKRIVQDILNTKKQKLYTFEGGFKEAERTMLILYPEKLKFLKNNNYINNIMKIIRNNEFDISKSKLDIERLNTYNAEQIKDSDYKQTFD